MQTPDERSFELRRTKVPFADYREKVCDAIARFLDDGPRSTKISLSFLATPLKKIFQPNSDMSIVDNRKDLLSCATDWIGRIIGGDLPDDVLRRIRKANIFGWNQIEIGDQFYLETRMLGDWVQPILMADKIKKARYGMCEGLRGHFGILWNGDLVYCCVDFDGNTAFGNVKSTSIRDALRQESVRETVRQFERCRIIHPYCRICLGDLLWRRSIVRQIGSILYHKVYRKYWTWKRSRGN